MTCAGGMFPTWEESPESQTGVHYLFPKAVGNCGNLGNLSASCETALRRPAVEVGVAVYPVVEDDLEQLAEQALDARVGRSGRGGPRRGERQRVVVPAIDRIDIEGARPVGAEAHV